MDLEGQPKKFLCLRLAGEYLNCSMQPLREWVREGVIQANGPRGQIPVSELVALVRRFESLRLHQKFDPSAPAKRFYKRGTPRRRPFSKLFKAEFDWPKGKKELIPSELAALVGCHPSFIILAIKEGYVPGHRRSQCRWVIRRADWALHIGLKNRLSP